MNPLYIDDTLALTLDELAVRVRRLARELGMIVADYVQRMQLSGDASSRANESYGTARSLKVPAE